MRFAFTVSDPPDAVFEGVYIDDLTHINGPALRCQADGCTPCWRDGDPATKELCVPIANGDGTGGICIDAYRTE